MNDEKPTIVTITRAEYDSDGLVDFGWEVTEDHSPMMLEEGTPQPAPTEGEEETQKATRDGVEWRYIDGYWFRETGKTAAEERDLNWIETVREALHDWAWDGRIAVGDKFKVEDDYYPDWTPYVWVDLVEVDQ